MNQVNESDKLKMLLNNKQNHALIRQRRQRTNFNDDAINILDKSFKTNPYPDINERELLANRLKTTEDRIQVWFQNKRARYRKRVENASNNKKRHQQENTIDSGYQSATSSDTLNQHIPLTHVTSTPLRSIYPPSMAYLPNFIPLPIYTSTPYTIHYPTTNIFKQHSTPKTRDRKEKGVFKPYELI